MIVDLFLTGVLGIFILLGALRGGVASGSGLLSLVAGYCGAVWAGSVFGPQVSEKLAVASLLGPPIAGSIGFVSAFVLCSVVGAVLRYLDRRRLGGLPRSGLDRALGGFFGALRGGFIVVLLSILVAWVDVARQFGVDERLSSLPPASSSKLVQASGVVVEKIVLAALSDAGPGAGVMAKLVANPSETLNSLKQLLEHEGFEALQQDRLFWTHIQHGSIDNALNQVSFYRLSQDEGLRQQLVKLSIVSPEEAADPRAFREAIAGALAEIGPALRSLNQDRALEKLAEDPEIARLLRSGDTVALIGHPKIRAVVEQVTAAL